jgi:hypothetical protein
VFLILGKNPEIRQTEMLIAYPNFIVNIQLIDVRTTDKCLTTC